MTSKISLRLKLSDFINTEIESEIMEKIDKTHNDLNIAVLLYLWFEGGEIDTSDLKTFLMRWEKNLSFKTVIKQDSTMKPDEFIWFDVVPIGLPYNSNKRFEFTYTNTKNIINGLQSFYDIAKFTTSEKPIKKQKRNDYED